MLVRKISAWCLVILAASAGAFAATPILPTVPQDLTTTTTELGHLAGGLELHISPDNSRLAFPTHAGFMSPADTENYDAKENPGLAALRIFIDGKPTIASAEFTTVLFSPDSQHVGYAMKARNSWQVMEDDRPIVTDAQNIPGLQGRGSPIVFSPDSQHVATVVQKNWHWFVSHDGVEWPIAGGINLPYCGLMTFSPDSQHVLVMGKGGRNSMQIYEDGVLLPPPPEPAPAPQGVRPLDHIFPLYTWAPDSSCIAYYGAFPEKRWQVFTTERVPFVSPQYDGILQNSLVFSGDSKQLVYVARERGKWHVVVDGNEDATAFDEVAAATITWLAATSEGQPERLVYIGRRGKEWNLYIDHKVVGDVFDGVVDVSFVVSPDRRHFAFAVARGNQAVLMRDGKAVGVYESIGAGTLAFSPDSEHLGYGIRRKMRWHAAVDGQIGTADFSGMCVCPVTFSPDSKNVAFQAQLNPGMMRLYVGINADYQSRFFETFLAGSSITWRDNKTLVTMAGNKMVAYRVEARIPE
ncbi:MAG TPA: hypothetical protein VM008_12920 [Phycisphaerae bacterium]|nr:hypothetical protein [Phycisphaerae bacterium]